MALLVNRIMSTDVDAVTCPHASNSFLGGNYHRSWTIDHSRAGTCLSTPLASGH